MNPEANLSSSSLSSSSMGRCKVKGEGCIKLPPDMVRINMTFEAESKEGITAQSIVAGRIAQGFKAELAAPLARDAIVIESSQSGLEPLYARHPADYAREPPKIIAFKASTSLTVVVNEMSLLNAVMAAAANASVTRIESQELSLRRADEQKVRALAEAATNALTKAKAIASALQMKVDQLVEIDEYTSEYGYESAGRGATYAMAASPHQSAVEPTNVTELGMVVIKAKVEATYTLKRDSRGSPWN